MSFLLVRGSDLVVLGVAWTADATASTPAGGGPAVLTASGNSARLIVTFPPQHVQEETSAPGTPAPLPPDPAVALRWWRARLSAPSRVAVSLPAGSVTPLTTEGILAALAAHPLAVDGGAGATSTALTVPSGLTVIPQSPTSAPVICRHPSTGPTDGAAALWRTRLSRSDSDTDGDIALTAVQSDPLDPGFGVALAAAERSDIAACTQHTPAAAIRLDLSALGATLDVAGTWDSFAWEQHCVLGRDMDVRTVTKGALYPFGHQAQLIETTTRTFDPTVDGAAVLRSQRVLIVTQTIREAAPDAGTRRGFPFPRVQIVNPLVVAIPAEPPWQPFTFNGQSHPTYFSPQTPQGERVSFLMRLENTADDVHAALPLIFVADLSSEGVDSLDDAALAGALAQAYGAVDIPIPGSTVNLVDGAPAAGQAPAMATVSADLYELQQISLAGLPAIPTPGDGYRVALSALKVNTPALRTLLQADASRVMRFAPDYLTGAATDVLLHIDPTNVIDVNFTKMTDRCGALVAPHYVADAISRTAGPVNLQALAQAAVGSIDPRTLFPADASILGFPLSVLLTDLQEGPRIVADLNSGTAPVITMTWTGVKLSTPNPSNGFVDLGAATLDLTVTSAPGTSTTHCTVNDFAFQFPAQGDPVLQLAFATITYDQTDGGPPRLGVTGVKASFLGALGLVEGLVEVVENALPPTGPLAAVGQLVTATRNGISVRYTFAPGPVGFGVFVLSNIAFSVDVEVPFTGAPVTLDVAFSTRANPFTVGVLMFAGSGHLELLVDHTGIRTFDAALEFGAFTSIDFVIVSADVYVTGGVEFTKTADGSITVTGYLHMGGHVDILGLVSLTLDLRLELSYQSQTNALVGRATLVISVNLTFWSDSLELDTGQWTLAGGPSHTHALFAAATAPFDGLPQWQLYRQSFATAPSVSTDATEHVTGSLR